MRINGFEQIKSFYSWVFNEPEKARPTHISLYLFLLNQNNRANWVEWFKCPYDLAMHGARIGNKGTYYRCLNDLKDWKIIDYKKGLNNFKAPLIKLFVLYDSGLVTVPLSEPQCEPQPVPQTVPQPVPQCEPQTGKKYKLVTSNIERITNNIEEVIIFLDGLDGKKTWRTDFSVYLTDCKKAFEKCATDNDFISTHERLNPGVDIHLTMEKAFRGFWGLEAGWKNKKLSKTKIIDWDKTIINSLSQQMNKVYKQK